MDSSDFKSFNDEELAIKCTTGETLYFEELIQRYHKKLFNYLHSRVFAAEDIEELVQETFIKAYSNIESFDPDLKFSTWIYTIATRLMYSFYRNKKNRENNLELEDNLVGFTNPAENNTDLKVMWKQAKNLPSIEYQVLKLRFKEELTLQEISAKINKNPEMVRILLHKAERNLSAIFKTKKQKKEST